MSINQFMPQPSTVKALLPLDTEFLTNGSSNNTSQITWTIPSIAIGSKQKLIVGFWCFNASVVVSSAFFGGNAGTRVGDVSSLSFWIFDKPSGSSSSLTVTINSAVGTVMCYSVWGVSNLSSPYDIVSKSSNLSPGNISFDVKSGGAIIAISTPGNGSAGNTTFSGVDADFLNATASGVNNRRWNGARKEFSSASSISVLSNYSASLDSRNLLAIAMR